MPQLDFSSYPSQLFWLAVSFTLLYWILAGFVLPRLEHIQKKRFEETQGKRGLAQQASEKAEQALNLYEEKIAAHKADLQKQAQHTQKQINDNLAKQGQEAKKNIEAKIREAEEEIKRAQLESKAVIEDAASIAAQDIAYKLAGINVSKDQALTMIKQVQSKTQ